MSKYLRKVPLDFKHGTGLVWKGYINPYESMPCTCCEQSGYNPETKKIADAWYAFGTDDWVYPNGIDRKRYNNTAWKNHITDIEVKALVEEERLIDFTHNWVKGSGWIKKEPEYIPTALEVNEWQRNGHGLGHDSINMAICVNARAQHLGVYGLCEKCLGEGYTFEQGIQELHDKWQPTDPPTGDGYQLWQNTSEDSPVSPVFNTLEALCVWCESNAHTFAYDTASKEQWYEMLKNDNVHSKHGNAIFI